MKEIILAVTLALTPAAALSNTSTFTEECWYRGVQNQYQFSKATCTVKDVRESKGGLVERTIIAKITKPSTMYVIKNWFGSAGLMTWDSDNRVPYPSRYRAIPSRNLPEELQGQISLPEGYAMTEVSRELWMKQIPWD